MTTVSSLVFNQQKLKIFSGKPPKTHAHTETITQENSSTYEIKTCSYSEWFTQKSSNVFANSRRWMMRAFVWPFPASQGHSLSWQMSLAFKTAALTQCVTVLFDSLTQMKSDGNFTEVEVNCRWYITFTSICLFNFAPIFYHMQKITLPLRVFSSSSDQSQTTFFTPCCFENFLHMTSHLSEDNFGCPECFQTADALKSTHGTVLCLDQSKH